MFIVQSSWPQGHCESSLGSFEECTTAPNSRRPSDQAMWLGLWVDPPVGSYRLQPPSPFIIITQPVSWYSFTVPRRVEGWVDLGTAGKMHTARAQRCKSQWLCDKHNCPQRNSIPEPRALQSGMLLLDHYFKIIQVINWADASLHCNLTPVGLHVNSDRWKWHAQATKHQL